MLARGVPMIMDVVLLQVTEANSKLDDDAQKNLYSISSRAMPRSNEDLRTGQDRTGQEGLTLKLSHGNK